MTDPNIENAAAAAEANLPLTLKLAGDAEAQSNEWMTHLRSRPPTNDAERQHYRDKAAEFRTLYTARLGDMEQSARLVAELVAQIEAQAGDDQVIILRKHLGPVLEGEAATARALASVLEVCLEIDSLT